MNSVKGKNENWAGSFWQLFLGKLIQLGIDPKQADWLIKWAEGFAKSMKGPLASRSAADVLLYLEKVAKRPNIKDWQVKQAVQALQHLYQDQYDSAWARKWQWDKAEAHALALLKQHANNTEPIITNLKSASIPRGQDLAVRLENPPEADFLDRVTDPDLKNVRPRILPMPGMVCNPAYGFCNLTLASTTPSTFQICLVR